MKHLKTEPWAVGSNDLTVEREDDNEAIYDAHRLYRYRLTRTWDSLGPRIGWVMLNPSTATASVDDPTITRVVGFSRSWGFGTVEVVNLFALRSPEPSTLRDSPDPVGPRNDDVLRDAMVSVDTVMVAWGNHGSMINPETATPRDREVRAVLAEHRPLSLGVTELGQPRHPLYLPASTAPVPLS